MTKSIHMLHRFTLCLFLTAALIIQPLFPAYSSESFLMPLSVQAAEGNVVYQINLYPEDSPFPVAGIFIILNNEIYISLPTAQKIANCFAVDDGETLTFTNENHKVSIEKAGSPDNAQNRAFTMDNIIWIPFKPFVEGLSIRCELEGNNLITDELINTSEILKMLNKEYKQNQFDTRQTLDINGFQKISALVANIVSTGKIFSLSKDKYDSAYKKIAVENNDNQFLAAEKQSAEAYNALKKLYKLDAEIGGDIGEIISSEYPFAAELLKFQDDISDFVNIETGLEIMEYGINQELVNDDYVDAIELIYKAGIDNPDGSKSAKKFLEMYDSEVGTHTFAYNCLKQYVSKDINKYLKKKITKKAKEEIIKAFAEELGKKGAEKFTARLFVNSVYTDATRLFINNVFGTKKQSGAVISSGCYQDIQSECIKYYKAHKKSADEMDPDEIANLVKITKLYLKAALSAYSEFDFDEDLKNTFKRTSSKITDELDNLTMLDERNYGFYNDADEVICELLEGTEKGEIPGKQFSPEDTYSIIFNWDSTLLEVPEIVECCIDSPYPINCETVGNIENGYAEDGHLIFSIVNPKPGEVFNTQTLNILDPSYDLTVEWNTGGPDNWDNNAGCTVDIYRSGTLIESGGYCKYICRAPTGFKFYGVCTFTDGIFGRYDNTFDYFMVNYWWE